MEAISPWVPWLDGVPARPAGSGELSGVRVAVKDLFAVAGLPTGAGHPTWLATHAPAEQDAPAVAALVGAGARLVGKTHTDEFAYSLMGTNVHYGAVANPAAPGHVTGGSSSGSAAAVASGEADLGLGTDTAGSVRVPAAWCGVYGLRPTHARVSREGIVPLAPSFDVPGLFARELGLLRLGAGLLLDGHSSGIPTRRLLLPADLWSTVEPEVLDALKPTVDWLTTRADTVKEALFTEPLDYPAAYAARTGYEFWQQHGAWVAEHRPTFGPGIGARIAAAELRTEAEVAEADLVRAKLCSILDRVLTEGTVLVLPTVATPAPPLSGRDVRGSLVRLTLLASLAGLPALNIPAGRAGGTPVGLSLVGPRGSDERLLDLATR